LAGAGDEGDRAALRGGLGDEAQARRRLARRLHAVGREGSGKARPVRQARGGEVGGEPLDPHLAEAQGAGGRLQRGGLLAVGARELRLAGKIAGGGGEDERGDVREVAGRDGQRALGEAARQGEPALGRDAADGHVERIEAPVARAGAGQRQASGRRLAADAAVERGGDLRRAEEVAALAGEDQPLDRPAERGRRRRLDAEGRVGAVDRARHLRRQARAAGQTRVDFRQIARLGGQIDGGAGARRRSVEAGGEAPAGHAQVRERIAAGRQQAGAALHLHLAAERAVERLHAGGEVLDRDVGGEAVALFGRRAVDGDRALGAAAQV
jgi:hypothetical protein